MINVQYESLDFGKSSFGQLHFPYYTADAVFVGGSNTLSTFCIIIIIHNIIIINIIYNNYQYSTQHIICSSSSNTF